MTIHAQNCQTDFLYLFVCLCWGGVGGGGGGGGGVGGHYKALKHTNVMLVFSLTITCVYIHYINSIRKVYDCSF